MKTWRLSLRSIFGISLKRRAPDACSLARDPHGAVSAPAELAAPSPRYAASGAVTARLDPAMTVGLSGTDRARPRLRAHPAKRLAG